MLFASATVWGMNHGSINENGIPVHRNQLTQVNGQTEDILESVAKMDAEKFRKAREEIRSVINGNQETREQFFSGIYRELNSKEPVDTSSFFRSFVFIVDSGLINRKNIVKLLLSGKHQIRLTTDQIKNIVVSNADVSDLVEYCKQGFPLHDAYKEGKKSIIKSLVNLGMDINQQNLFNETLLSRACGKGDLDMVKHLIFLGANINQVDSFGYTPLLIAHHEKRENIVKYLIDNGADVSRESPRTGETILFDALRCESYSNTVINGLNQGKTAKELGVTSLFENMSPEELLSIYSQRFLYSKNIIRYLLERGVTE